jgi:hypothetical protein
MKQGLESFFHNTAFVYNGPPALRDLAVEQDQLGWDQFLCGRLSKKWQQIQDNYLTAYKRPKSRMHYGTLWVKHWIHFYWHESWTLWTIRNEDRHGKDAESKLHRSYLQFRAQTEALYEQREQCVPSHRNILFYPSLQEHLHKEDTPQRLQSWIQLNEGAITASVSQHRQQGGTPALRQTQLTFGTPAPRDQSRSTPKKQHPNKQKDPTNIAAKQQCMQKYFRNSHTTPTTETEEIEWSDNDTCSETGGTVAKRTNADDEADDSDSSSESEYSCDDSILERWTSSQRGLNSERFL